MILVCLIIFGHSQLLECTNMKDEDWFKKSSFGFFKKENDDDIKDDDLKVNSESINPIFDFDKCYSKAKFAEDASIYFFASRKFDIQLFSFNHSSKLYFTFVKPTNFEKIDNVTIDLTFNSGLDSILYININNNVIINPKGTSSDRAAIVLTKDEDCNKESTYCGIYGGTGNGPSLVYNCNSSDYYNFSYFSRVDIVPYVNTKIFDSLKDNAPNLKESYNYDKAFAFKNAPKVVSYVEYFGDEMADNLKYVKKSDITINLDDGEFTINVYDTTIQINAEKSKQTITYDIVCTEKININLGDGKGGVLTLVANSTNIVPKLKIINSEYWEIVIKGNSWNNNNININGNDSDIFLRIESTNPGLYIYNAKDVNIILYNNECLIDSISTINSLHFYKTDQSQIYLKVKELKSKYLIADDGIEITVGTLDLSNYDYVKESNKLKVTYRLSIPQNVEFTKSKQTLDDRALENEKYVPKYIELTDNALISLKSVSGSENLIYISDTIKLPGSKYYLDFNDNSGYYSTNEEEWVLCQPNLNCKKFELSFRSLDYFKDQEDYHQEGEVYEMICKPFTEINKYEIGCCGYDQMNDYTRSIKCIGYKNKVDVQTLKKEHSTYLNDHLTYEDWRYQVKEYWEKISLYSSYSTKEHPLFFDASPINNLEFIDYSSNNGDIMYIDLIKEWSNATYSLNAPNKKVFFRNLNDNKPIIPFTRLNVKEISNDFGDLSFSRVKELTIPIDYYNDEQNKIISLKIPKIILSGNKEFSSEKCSLTDKTQKGVTISFSDSKIEVVLKDKEDQIYNMKFSTSTITSFTDIIKFDFNNYENGDGTKYKINIKTTGLFNNEYKYQPINLNYGQIDISEAATKNLILYNDKFNTSDNKCDITIRSSNFSINANQNVLERKKFTFNKVICDKGYLYITFNNYAINKVIINTLEIVEIDFQGIYINCNFDNNEDREKCPKDKIEVEINNLISKNPLTLRTIINSNDIEIIPKIINSTSTNSKIISGGIYQQSSIINLEDGPNAVLFDDYKSTISSNFPNINVKKQPGQECIDAQAMYSILYPNIPGFEVKNQLYEGYSIFICSSQLSCNQMTGIQAEEKVQICEGQYYNYEFKCFDNLTNQPNLQISNYLHTYDLSSLSPIAYNCVGYKEVNISFSRGLESPHDSFMESGKKLSAGAIAGIVIGCVAFVVIIVILLLIFVFHVIKCGGNKDKSESVSSK